MIELNPEKGRLDRIKTAIEALVNIMIPPVGAIVGKRPHCISKIGVRGRHSSGIAYRTNIFSRIKTESRSIAKATCAGGLAGRRPRSICPYGLGIVLNNNKPMSGGGLCHKFIIAWPTVEMNCKYSLGARAYTLLNKRCIKIERAWIGFNKDGRKTTVGHRQHRGYIRICRHNNLIARSKSSKLNIGPENKPECIKPVADTDGIDTPGMGRKLTLECLHFLSADVTARVNHSDGSFFKLIGVRGINGAKVKKRILQILHRAELSFINSSNSRT